ncbi:MULTISPECIES: hypothetical protein [Caballeronia]|uniref:Restriction endonuclease n=1 Tax=Caballeronia jiangsuensis TaxID=1458357 RepID=A0ABW9CR13_9BURK|nr:hypothetical protein [Caballeronia sp. GaOx3]
MEALNETQKALAVRELEAFLSASPDSVTGKTPVEECRDLDENRRAIIASILRPALDRFFDGAMSLADFKPEIDRTNKRHEYWGFKGIKGQMFFNLLYNACVDEAELAAELKLALQAPADEAIAKSRIRNFASYVRRIGEDYVAGGASKHARPKISSIPFFLSYFWQVFSPERWPIYYTNSVQVLSDLNLYQPADDPADAYIEYVELHVEVRDLFAKTLGRPVTYYDVEHVWWYTKKHADKAVIPAASIALAETVPSATLVAKDKELALSQLPDSYVPPIVSIIPRLALNDSLLETAAATSGISIARALEKSIHAAFTILGYDAQLLGQGQGRVQDGLAISADYSYAILWDAKARQRGYTMGTDDRAIREYITTQSRQLKRHRHLRNLYYVLISSSFQDEFDDLIRELKMETDISEVRLVTAEAIVAIVDEKMRDPNQLTLGPDGVQRLFCSSGILTADDVREELG